MLVSEQILRECLAIIRLNEGISLKIGPSCSLLVFFVFPFLDNELKKMKLTNKKNKTKYMAVLECTLLECGWPFDALKFDPNIGTTSFYILALLILKQCHQQQGIFY